MSTSTLPVFQSVMTLYSGTINNLYCSLQFPAGSLATFSPFLLLNCLVMCSDFAINSLQSRPFVSNPRFLLLPSCASWLSSSSVLSFALDSRWGLHADRLALGKGQTYARSVPGLSLLQAADRTLTSCHLTSDLLVADVAVTQGRHYWACSVEPGSYLVKVGYSDTQVTVIAICVKHKGICCSSPSEHI